MCIDLLADSPHLTSVLRSMDMLLCAAKPFDKLTAVLWSFCSWLRPLYLTWMLCSTFWPSCLQRCLCTQTPVCLLLPRTFLLLRDLTVGFPKLLLTQIGLCCWGAARQRLCVLLRNVLPLSSLEQLYDGKRTCQGWQMKTPACAHNQWLPRSFCQALAQRVVPLLQKAKLRLPLQEATAASSGFVRQHKFSV